MSDPSSALPPKKQSTGKDALVMCLVLLGIVPLVYIAANLNLTEVLVALLFGSVPLVLIYVFVEGVRGDKARRLDELLKRGMTPDEAGRQLVRERSLIRRQGSVIFLCCLGWSLLMVLVVLGFHLAGTASKDCFSIAMGLVFPALVGAMRGFGRMISGVTDEERQP